MDEGEWNMPSSAVKQGIRLDSAADIRLDSHVLYAIYLNSCWTA